MTQGTPAPHNPDGEDEDTGMNDRQAEYDPRPFQLAGEPPRVMRLSRRALATIGVAASFCIGGTLIYALQPQRHDKADNLIPTETRARSDKVLAGPADYGTAPKLGPPLPGDLGGPIVAAQECGEIVPIPPVGAQSLPPATPDPRLAALEQARQAALQEHDSARTSQLFLDAATKAQGATPQAISAPAAPGATSGKQSFLQTQASGLIESSARIVGPASPRTLHAGSIIPAALITAIRSDLPGQVTAQVTQNVYDSATGRILLIPQGARLIGEYDSEVMAGQSRVLLAWDRIILPGGRSISLERFPGADAAGIAGLSDRTDYHWGNMLRAAFVSTLLGAGAEFVSGDDGSLARALRFGTQDTVNETGRRIVERQLSVPPSLSIRSGFPLRVIVTRDLVLETEGTGK